MFDWSQYVNYAEIKQYEKDTILFKQGDITDGFYYLVDGKVVISVLRKDGFERIIDYVFPEQLIGEQTIVQAPSFTTAKVMTDSTLYYFTLPQLALLIKSEPEAAQQFGYSLISKIRMLANINSILNAPADTQLAYFLLKLQDKKGSKLIDVTQTSIAKYIGKSRVAVWKILKEWRTEGIIEIDNQSFVIKNIGKLKEKTKHL